MTTTTLTIAFALWFVFAYLPTMAFYFLARRDVAEARRLRDEARQLAEFAKTPPASIAALVRAMQQERDGATLQ
jgi:hypothetical protein